MQGVGVSGSLKKKKENRNVFLKGERRQRKKEQEGRETRG